MCRGLGAGQLASPTGTYKIAIELREDGTSSDRQNASLCELGKGVRRDYGVDLCAAVLNAPPTIQKTDSLWQEVKDLPEAREVYEKALARFSLNGQQKEAAEMSFTSPSGLLTQWGPPGTGKTTCALAMVLGHIKVGKLWSFARRPVLA